MGEITDKVQGKAREVKGSATGDAGEELKGKAQQVKGKVEGAMNDAGADTRAAADRTDADVNSKRAKP
jgi:uncharacterized protein YjbJ (UPF0337 family)